ncbi:MAG: DUF3363 domain-containing protein [Polaromonas sp.]|nr:DUF3363 domain-containing protein [Polaromonas sp.]
MPSRDDDRFRIRPAAPRSRSAASPEGAPRFVSQVLKAASKAGGRASGARGGPGAAGSVSTFGRGRVAAGMAGQKLGRNARRVIIKSRFVVLKKAAAKSVATHLRYIERDGVARDGQRGHAYSALTDAVDLKAFEERGQGDRHQFRYIVSVEDAAEMGDLRGYIRDLLQRMAADLETRLDWVAVDHWDTDNPHTHIVLRGRIGQGRQGQDLVIAPGYMAHGMRLRASEIATEWLGPRTELEIRKGLLREVELERLTSLDRMLLQHAAAGVVDLTESSANATAGGQRQTMLRARLHRLESMALAERVDANRWRLSPSMRPTLAALGERSDILRTMHKALRGEQRELTLEAELATPVVGCIATKGLADELHDRGYVVVDGVDGRAHYLKLPAGTDLSALPVGGVIAATPPGSVRPVDRNILAIAKGGIYKTADHLSSLAQAAHGEPGTTVDAHVRRLEALRRAGIVERIADGVWKLPQDFARKAREHDMHKAEGATIELRSHLPIAQQVRAIGATWLDQQLVTGDVGLATRGFGARVRDAMIHRVEFLSEEGLAERHGQRVVLARNLLATLRERELASAGKALQDQTGSIHRPTRTGESVSGVYRRSIQLASGRFAMLDDGMGFSLVPWRPVVEQKFGQQVSAIVRGSSVSFQFGRTRSVGV